MKKFFFLKTFVSLFLATLTFASCSSDESSDSSTPVITLLGEANVSALQNSNYIDAGAIASDDVDGDLTSSIVTSGDVDTSIIGSYTITYSVSNSAGNSDTISRLVTVIEDSNNPIYLDANGITVKAKEWAKVGMEYELNGWTYLVVDDEMIRDLNLATDLLFLNKLVTTKVTDMWIC